MKKFLILFVSVALLVFLAKPVLAGQPIFEPVPADIIDKFDDQGNWNTMTAKSNPDNTFKQVEYYVKSTGATNGIKYRTKLITFAVGPYGPASFDASQLRSHVPEPGETVYDKVILDRDFFRALIGVSIPNGPALVGQALDTENYLVVGAVIEIYNASTGQVLASINSQEECQTKGEAQGFGTDDIADMKSRWQQVPLRSVQPPDFFPTPEGSYEWQESYKDPATGAASYDTAQPGEQLNFVVKLNNSGAGAITDFKAVWYGHGSDPVGGWSCPIWNAGEVNLEQGQTQEFTVTITVPQPNEENRLVFKANVDNHTPANESNLENNLMIICIGRRPDLKAVSINTGVSGGAVAGNRYGGTVTFQNTSNCQLNGVHVGAYNNGYRAILKDDAGQTVTTTDFEPNETKAFSFGYTVPYITGLSELMGAINIDPLPVVYQESITGNNKVYNIVGAPVGGGNEMDLTFLAHRQKSWHEVIGEPQLFREPNTAKFTDIVVTTLTPANTKPIQRVVFWGEDVNHFRFIAPPHPENQSVRSPGHGEPPPSYSYMRRWSISEARLTYPDQSPGFTFGHPFWNGETKSKDMNLNGETATANFKEMWSLDGAPIFDPFIQAQIPGPQEYRITANYKIKVEYYEVYYLFGGDDYYSVVTEVKVKYYNYTGYGDLLINGAGAAPVATQNVIEFKDAYPWLRTNDPYWD